MEGTGKQQQLQEPLLTAGAQPSMRTSSKGSAAGGAMQLGGCAGTLGAGLMLSWFLGASFLSMLVSTLVLFALVALILVVERLLIEASAIKQHAIKVRAH